MKNCNACLAAFLPCLIISALAEAQPVRHVSPAELSLTAGLDSSDTTQLVISNSGNSELTFELTDNLRSDGYTYKNSNMAGGPVYDWIDIDSNGRQVIFNEHVSRELDIGFDFPFYGSSYSKFWIMEKGGISFSPETPGYYDSYSYWISRFPSTYAPSQSLLVLWDYYLRQSSPYTGNGTVLYDSTPERLVVTWKGVLLYDSDYYSEGARYYVTFQIVIYPDGRIVYQYKTLEGDWSWSAVGLQDDNRSGPAITVAGYYNNHYLENEMAIEFVWGASGWVDYSPDQGSIASGESQAVTVTASSIGLSAGNYSAELTVSGNDLENPSEVIPVTFDVLGDDSDADGLPDYWENEHFGGNTSADPSADPDSDGYSNEQEYWAGLDPNKADTFCINALDASQNGVLEWTAVPGRVYSVYWTSNLVEGFPDTPIASQITGGTFTDSMHKDRKEGFYRLEVELEP